MTTKSDWPARLAEYLVALILLAMAAAVVLRDELSPGVRFVATIVVMWVSYRAGRQVEKRKRK